MESIQNILYKRNTPTLLICSPEYEPAAGKPDHTLYISPHENHYRKMSSFSTRLSILFILDVLYASYFQKDYDNNVLRKLEYYDYIRKSSE